MAPKAGPPAAPKPGGATPGAANPARNASATPRTPRSTLPRPTRWGSIAASLRDPRCLGLAGIRLVSQEPLWSEDALPFEVLGAGNVLHLKPRAGFSADLLAGSADERLLVVECPDDEGWLVPEGLVAHWMARHVRNEALDDVLLSHPLYQYLVEPDEDGNSRGGMGLLVHWTPGIPTHAALLAPEHLPEDEDAPRVNRDVDLYARAVVDLLDRLHQALPILEVEAALAWAPPRRARAGPEGPSPQRVNAPRASRVQA